MIEKGIKGTDMLKKLLNNLSILQLTLISSGVLSVFIIVILIQNLSSNWQESQSVKQDVEMIDVLDALEKIAHNHAVERGLTAGYLGSGSEQAYGKVIAQRKKADASIIHLRQTLNNLSFDAELINRSLTVLFEHEKNKRQIRSNVDAKNAPQAFGYYSTLNQIALDSAAALRNRIEHSEVGKGLVSAFLFAEFKERLGQNRGKINGVLAKRQLAPAVQKQISFYNQELELLSKYLKATLEREANAKIVGILKNPTSQQINKITQTLLSNLQPDFSKLPASSVWFPLATKQIGQIKAMLDAQWVETKTLGQNMQSSATRSFYVNIVGFLIATLVIFAINLHLITSLRKELKYLTQVLKEAEKGDLTVDVRIDSKDELGIISSAIYNTIYAFKDLMLGLDKSVNAGTDLSLDMNRATNELLDDSNKTQKMATNIATAIEEMAATSIEIAESATKTLAASDDLNQQSELLLIDNQKSQHSMADLSTSMRDVENLAGDMELQVQSITSILDTISQVAEQTNLLALNAAIEAARAGEMGRGFAVVADEVRSLAASSKESSDKIAELLNLLRSISEQVVSSIKHNANLTNTALDDFARSKQIADSVCEHIKNVENLAMGVSTAAEQQSTVAANIAQDTAAVLDLANHELEAAEKLEIIFRDMKVNSEVLQRTMNNFKF